MHKTNNNPHTVFHAPHSYADATPKNALELPRKSAEKDLGIGLGHSDKEAAGKSRIGKVLPTPRGKARVVKKPTATQAKKRSKQTKEIYSIDIVYTILSSTASPEAKRSSRALEGAFSGKTSPTSLSSPSSLPTDMRAPRMDPPYPLL